MTENRLAARHGHLPVGTRAPVDPVDAPVPTGSFIDIMGIELLEAGPGSALARMVVGAHHLNQAGVAQAGAVVALADAAAGWAAKAALAEGTGFTTLELNLNLLRAARPGHELIAEVVPVHVGRSSMVLTVDVRVEEGGSVKTVAAFRCTEMVLR